MHALISLSAAAAPALLLVVYFYRADKARREPKRLVNKVFFLGILSTIPAIILELLVSRFQPLLSLHPILVHFFDAFIVAALCEEGIKLFVVKRSAWRNPAFDEIADGIVYTVVASLGFACMENILYVLQGGLSLALIRAFTAIPLHALASGLMGYYLGRAKFAASPREQQALTGKGFLLAFLIHGYYDFVLFGIESFGYLPALTIVPLLIFGLLKLRSLMKSAIAADRDSGRVA